MATVPNAHPTAWLVTATILTLGLTSCAETAGQATPQPGSTTATTTRSSDPTPPSTKPASSNELDKLDPCILLSESDVAQFGAGIGVPKNTTRSRACQWTVSGQGVFTVALRAEQGLDDIVVSRGTVADHPVGDHDGRKLEADDGPGGCMISIGISESARVDTSSSTRSDTAKACEFAGRVAELIEPKLPKGE
ncbi:DUF3558 family protein [Actinokineospora sp.]|uniref:DUF3558 family protein n=1 Tax=Actinokineospora sp. TaxID=1872133 RepID=UPI004037C3DB